MRIIVVGAGAQGGPAAMVLSRDKEVDEVILADINTERLKAVKDHIKSDKVRTERVDAAKVEELVKAMKGMDGAVNLIPCRFNLQVMEAAIEAGVHYSDSAVWYADYKNILALDEGVKDAGVTHCIACGGTKLFLTRLAEAGLTVRFEQQTTKLVETK